MASTDPDSSVFSKAHETRSHWVNANHVNMESMSDENDRNSNVSPSKSSDPARKKTFKIISVKKGGTGSGDLVTDNDADSVDGLDESQTEDLSSEFYDSSKATDLDLDVQDTPLTPDEVTSTTTIVMKQKPDQNSQSRFKVVKIETKEPFRRGKWVCHDFFDTAPAAVVTLNGSKATEDSIIQSALSGTLSSSTSVHYVHDANESSSNLFVAPVVALSPSAVPGQPILTDMFFPIQPAPASQVQSNIDGLPTVVTQYPQPIHMSVPAKGPSSSSSFHSLAQSGLTTIVQSLPQTNVFPYAQNGPSSTFLNGPAAEKTSQSIAMPNTSVTTVSGSGQSVSPSMVTISSVAEELLGMGGPGQLYTVTSPEVVIAPVQPPVQPQLPLAGTAIPDGGTVMVAEESKVGGRGITSGAILGAVGQTSAGVPLDANPEFSALADQMGPGMDESMSSVKTLEPGDAQDPAKLEEAVETMYIGLEGNEEDNDDESGGSTVAIDNKIEQAMDLVKRHLMYAVREEVEILKQQIGDMMERIGQLEYENTLLRAEAKPETLNKLLLPRSTQPGTQQQQPQPAANAQMAASVTQGGTSQPQAQPAVVVVQAQQPTQSIPAGQQTTATMLPPSQQQQQQVTPSGTSTPTPQVPQQQLQQAVQQQQPHHQAPAPQASMS